MAAWARRSLAVVILNGRPRLRPRARADARPALVRPTISSRSNSAGAAKKPNRSLPFGIVMDGQEIDAPDPSRILVFQDPTLYPWRTVRQNVALGPEARGQLRAQGGRIEEVLRQVGL